MNTATLADTPTSASRRARRLARRSALAACTVAALAAPGVAFAADTLVVPDPAANEVAALDGTVVWLSGFDSDEERNTDQVLMQRTGGVIKRVDGAPRAGYESIDLGRDSKGKLVLTYMRCSKTKCTPIRDNLRGKRASFKHLTLKRCSLEQAPAVWGTRLAYGQYCRKPNGAGDDKRSGLYVKAGAGRTRRLRVPAKANSPTIPVRDLRGSRVAAVAGAQKAYAFTETVGGTGLRSLRVIRPTWPHEGLDVSLQSTNVMWTLAGSETPGEPWRRRVEIVKMLKDCYERETISPAAPSAFFPATDLAADGTTLYLVVPLAGIVEHDFAPAGGCTKL